jgi:ATP-dependent Zn protease
MTERTAGSGPGRTILVAVIIVAVVLGVTGIIYAWISAPSASTVSYSQFLDDVEAGAVTSVHQQGSTLQVDRETGGYVVTVPSLLTDVFADVSEAATDGNVSEPQLSASPEPEAPWLGVLLTWIFPVLLVLLFGFILLGAIRSSRRVPTRTLKERLQRLDEAHKAGLVTDEELARQRSRILDEA